MSANYPEKAMLFLALTRPALVWGVSIEYLFFSLSLTLSLIILMNSLAYSLLAIVFYSLGRVVFYWDYHLIPILIRRFSKPVNQLTRALGQTYYEIN